MSEPEVPVRAQLAEVGTELGRDLFTTVVVAVVLIGGTLVGGLIGALRLARRREDPTAAWW